MAVGESSGTQDTVHTTSDPMQQGDKDIYQKEQSLTWEALCTPKYSQHPRESAFTFLLPLALTCPTSLHMAPALTLTLCLSMSVDVQAWFKMEGRVWHFTSFVLMKLAHGHAMNTNARFNICIPCPIVSERSFFFQSLSWNQHPPTPKKGKDTKLNPHMQKRPVRWRHSHLTVQPDRIHFDCMLCCESPVRDTSSQFSTSWKGEIWNMI